MMKGRGQPRRLAIGELTVGLALIGGAMLIATVGGRGPQQPQGQRDVVGSATVPGLRLGELPSSPPPLPAEEEARQVGIVPHRIQIPKLHVDAPVTEVGVAPGGSLEIPVDPQVIGWWSEGARPGGSRGTALLAGHINTAASGPGAFAQLDELRPGDEIVVMGDGHRVVFAVRALRQFSKGSLDAEVAFSQDVAGRLAIVSCGGVLDEALGHYPDNIVVYATITDDWPDHR